MAASSVVQDSHLFGLPQEIRDNIYLYTSERPEGPGLIIKEYLEEIDPDIPNVEVQASQPQATVVATGIPDGNTSDQLGQAGNATELSVQAELSEQAAGDTSLAGLDANGNAAVYGHNTGHATKGIGRQTKYRHMLHMFTIDRCPPPISILIACKQINQEATQHHRSQCTLTIDVCKGFQHQSFFLETIAKLTNAPFSPLEQIRKLHLILTWDSEMLREASSPDFSDPPVIEQDMLWYFNFFLGERIRFVNDLIKACPELRSVTLEYHDTEETSESRVFMTSQLLDLRATIAEKGWKLRDPDTGVALAHNAVNLEVKELFSQPGTFHPFTSKLGKRRDEFQEICYDGLGWQ